MNSHWFLLEFVMAIYKHIEPEFFICQSPKANFDHNVKFFHHTLRVWKMY